MRNENISKIEGLKRELFKGDFKVSKIEDYLVDISYGQKDWTMVSALREILANMLDTKTEYSYTYENGVGTISDKGTGLPRKAFVIGASTKSNDNTSIGQYGEGLKMALITSLRYDRGISIRTVGYGVEVTKVYSEEYNTTLMRLIYNDNMQDVGTTIKIECTKEEWEDAVDLFLQFKEGYQKLDNNLYLPGGYISILGLKTEEKPNMLFSYDLNDKTITNRDRNTVKTKKLKENMENILNKVKTQKAIKCYLEGLEEFSDAEEYKIELNPKNVDIWKSVIYKMYGEKVAYSTTIDADIKATVNGYKILKATNKRMQNTFKNIGIISSRQGAKGVKSDIGIEDNKEDKITYPISKNYVDSWGYIDAGREIMANAFDSATSVENAKIEYKNGYCTISDDGIGIAKKNFVIGNSQKSNNEIGMFGEGLKLASLVMARENRDMSIKTVDYTYYPILEENEDFGTEVFSIKFEENKKKKGTEISFKATEEEVEQIKNLFILFKENVDMVKGDLIDVILSESNNVYVRGLKSATIDSIFSYNVKDKTLVNTRDRNNVDENKLSSILVDFYNNTTNKTIINIFLSHWKEMNNQYYFEYKLVINPKNLDIWKEVALSIFDKHCISSLNMEDNFISKQAGYEVLTNIPPYVKDILEYCLPKSSEIAEEYRDKGILFDNKIIFPITENYIKNWTKEDAIRELISNALDTNTEVSATVENNICVISDKGMGIAKKNLLIGESESRGSHKAIGVFGEGLKMSALTLAKSNAELVIETVGYTVEVSLKSDKDFGVDFMVFELTPNDRKVGTDVIFKCDKYTLEETKSKFLIYNDNYEKIEDGIYSSKNGTNALFINGVKIRDNANALYTYNLEGKEGKKLLNRDRNNVDYQDVLHPIADLISEVKSDEIIKTVLSGRITSSLESGLVRYPYLISGAKKRKWKRIMGEVFGKACLPTFNSELNLVAKDKGYSVLTELTDLQMALLKHLGMPYANEVASKPEDAEDIEVIEEKDLTENELKKWNIVKKAVESYYGKDALNHIKVCKELSRTEFGVTLGCYNSGVDMCYMVRDLLSDSKSISSPMGVIFHELEHRVSGASDRTREFENALTDVIGNLLEKMYIG